MTNAISVDARRLATMSYVSDVAATVAAVPHQDPRRCVATLCNRLEVVDDVVAVELHDGVAWYVAHAIAGSSARAAATANLT